ncbi:hypothetical protein ACFL09_00435 [Planctomycetota bacterium]
MSPKHIKRRRSLVKRTGALIIMVTAWLGPVDGQVANADEVYRANPKPPTDGLVGANYTPAYAVNQVQFWHDFRPKVVERELAAAREHFGISTLRVYMHNINFDEEKDVFLTNLEEFLTIYGKHGIRPGLVFFDDCHRDGGIFLDKPTTPVKGFHNGRWAWCPQKRERDPGDLEKFKPYVQEVIRAHRMDKRVLFWEIFNEPAPEFDLRKLDCKVLPDVWNLIRVAVEGPRIRVWLNRMHPSSDPDRGLRIDFTDTNNPILSGAIGVRAHRVSAWFDNIVALPLDVLPQSPAVGAPRLR